LRSADQPPESTAAALQALADRAARGSPLRAVILQRIGQSEERAGRWAEAARAYEQASAIEDFPLRYWALLSAARCLDRAGQPDRALAAYDRIEAEAPTLVIPEHLRTRVRELQALAAR
jgi:tetratricopeptide (TPR) repeat protein